MQRRRGAPQPLADGRGGSWGYGRDLRNENRFPLVGAKTRHLAKGTQQSMTSGEIPNRHVTLLVTFTI